MTDKHDTEMMKAPQKVLKIFDADGNVCEDCVVACTQIFSHENTTIFFYDDQSIQIMVNDQVKYDLSLI